MIFGVLSASKLWRVGKGLPSQLAADWAHRGIA